MYMHIYIYIYVYMCLLMYNLSSQVKRAFVSAVGKYGRIRVPVPQ